MDIKTYYFTFISCISTVYSLFTCELRYNVSNADRVVVVVDHCFMSLFGTKDDDVRVGVIGHGGLLRAFSFARPIRGSWHV